jgi:hypothetical protein
MEQGYGPLAVGMVPGKHCDFSTYLAKRAQAQSVACAEMHFPVYGTVLWSPVSRNGSRKHCEFSTYLSESERAQSGECAEFIFLIMEQCCGPLAVEIIPGNTAISATNLQRERELSLAHAQRSSFLIKEQCCGPLAVEIIPGKHFDFITYLAKRARAQSGACAEVQFPD